MASEPPEKHSKPDRNAHSITAPLRIPLFRRVWTASLLSNLGLLMMSVGAAWSMTQMTGAADMIALVQTAMMLPMMLIALPAGAIADMYDRRKVGMFALSVSLVSASSLTVTTGLGFLSPWLLLLFTFMIGTGMALFGPAWQASVSEQVPVEALPQAVALNSISFNIARSIGPAIGGMLVATAGAVSSFALNAIFYIPQLVVLLLWRRELQPSRLPPERLSRAITSGIRYVRHSPSIRVVLVRTLLASLSGTALIALMPVVSRDLLHGGAFIYGLLLAAFGVGAIISALNISIVRNRLSSEVAIVSCALMIAVTTAVIAVSHNVVLTIVALIIAGAGWMLTVTLFNIAIQLSAPRWVAARTLATFQTAIAAGVSFGAWFWGHIAESHGITISLLDAAAAMGATTLFGRWLPMPPTSERAHEPVDLGAPDVALAVTGRSGPIVVEIEYRVEPDQARAFYGAMQLVQRTRHRNGAYDWSISRDLTDPEIWTERFHCPTWHDYLRLRSRYAPSDIALQEQANAFHKGPEAIKIRRMLERPFGSVRWREDARDVGTEVLPV